MKKGGCKCHFVEGRLFDTNIIKKHQKRNSSNNNHNIIWNDINNNILSINKKANNNNNNCKDNNNIRNNSNKSRASSVVKAALRRAFYACVYCIAFSKKLRWLAQTEVITLKTQLHAVNARWKRLSQLSLIEHLSIRWKFAKVMLYYTQDNRRGTQSINFDHFVTLYVSLVFFVDRD